MTGIFEDFFSVRQVVELKKTPSPSPRHGRSEKKIYYLLTETPPLLLLIGYESLNTISLGWSVCCYGIMHLKRLAVQWLVYAVDQRQDWLGG